MELDELVDGIKKGKYTALFFTSDKCSWCDKMKKTIADVDLPVNELQPDKNLVESFDLKVAPTLVIISDKSINKISGYKDPRKLKECLRELH